MSLLAENPITESPTRVGDVERLALSGLPLAESVLLSTGRRNGARGVGAQSLAAQGLVQIELEPRTLIPTRPLGPGEQYRFHFDMTKCIGCKCCVVACNEQNGNPADLNWRRVGEIEGGYYPYAQRFHLSMGCNHCVEPSCMIGCPVEAYTKDSTTGVVIHSADTCIGCQYCTWNCSYGVPQYNSARGVVGKCDMCHNRLADDMAPACVNACPEGAIEIEIVNIAEWRRDYMSANAPGLPSADDSISTTRVTLPKDMVPDTNRVDTNLVDLEHPHWPLVFMLVVTQLCVGAFAVMWLMNLYMQMSGIWLPALASLGLAGMSLGASTLHLGRPIHAMRALKGLRRSWLSREVLALSLFAGAASLFAGMLFLDLPGQTAAGLATVLTGILGVTCSARIYIVRARPAWYSGYTLGEFYSSALLLGPLFVGALLLSMGEPVPMWARYAAVAGASAQLLTQLLKYLWLSRSEAFELKSSAMLLSGPLHSLFLARFAILAVAGIVIPLTATSAWLVVAAFVVALFGEWLGRYLFFVSVVPKSMAAAFSAGERRAA